MRSKKFEIPPLACFPILNTLAARLDLQPVKAAKVTGGGGKKSENGACGKRKTE
jgi:hypothetical protein